jgi:hypothetical protein
MHPRVDICLACRDITRTQKGILAAPWATIDMFLGKIIGTRFIRFIFFPSQRPALRLVGRMVNGLLRVALIGLAMPNLSCSSRPGPVSFMNTLSTLAAVPLSVTGKPRLRMGRAPTGAVIGSDLGKHGYTPNLSERNGIVFTCRGGQIDTAHTRKSADWTCYLTKVFLVHIENNETSFSFRMPEPSRYFVRLAYPDNWHALAPAERKAISREVAIELGSYAAYVGTTWHEMLTWVGYKAMLIMPEFFSAFSWEENFSNVLGARMAAKALRDEGRSYDDALTAAFDEELVMLGAQPARVAKRVRREEKGEWYTGPILNVDVRKRHFDIGIDDGFVTPIVFPIPECEGIDPVDYPAPHLETIRDYGFEITLEIEPVIKEELLRLVYPNESIEGKRINPEKHFGLIMKYMQEEAIELYGPDCYRATRSPARIR